MPKFADRRRRKRPRARGLDAAAALLLMAAPTHAFAHERTERVGCLGLMPLERAGRESCWLRAAPIDGTPPLCLEHRFARRWLDTEGSGETCGTWRGYWKVTAPRRNGDTAFPAEVRTEFVAEAPTHAPGEARSPLGPLARGRRVLERWRERVAERLAPMDRLGIFRKLLLDQTVPGAPTALLRELGFVHLVTATGIHLYALAALWRRALFAASVGAGASPRAALAIARICAVSAWASAWALAGARTGMLRPWLVVGARTLAEAAGFRWRAGAPLAIALALDLAAGLVRAGFAGHAAGADLARAALDPGRVFYALAVGGGLLAGGNHACMAISSWIFAALWEGATDGHVAIFTPLLSLLTIPWLVGVVYPSVWLCAILDTRGEALRPLLALTETGAAALGQLTLRYQGLWIVPAGAVAAGVGLAAAGFVPAVARRRAGAITVGAILAVRAGASLAEARTARGAALGPATAERIEQLDVGQGDAALVVRAGDAAAGLIDAGSDTALSDADWLRLLTRRRLREIAWIGLTHLDADHAGGVRRLARLVPLGCVATARGQLESPRGAAFVAELRALGVEVREWAARGCVPFPVLAPKAGAAGKANAAMSALLIPLRGGGFYLSGGDADAFDEPRIGRWAQALAADLAPGPRVLKLSHHGSRTSSAPEYLTRIAPTEAWISVGTGNSYGHPATIVLDRVARAGIPVRRTDRDGELVVRARSSFGAR